MLTLLKRYIRLLTVLFGTRCAHLLEVQGVYQVLAEKAAVYESMSGELVAETIWQVFLDARECFSHLGPGLPESSLYTLRHYIRSCSLKATINCPVALLLNIPSVPSAVSHSSVSSNSRSSITARMSGGSMAPSTMSALTSSADTRRTRDTIPIVGGKRKNPDPIPEFVDIMRELRTQRPGADMNALMRSERLLIADIGIGGRGACLDFMYVGECSRPGCTFNHEPANVLAGKRRDCVKKLTKAVAGYLEHNPSGA